MDLSKYFERRKREDEEAIQFAKTKSGFRLWQKTIDGEKDITADHIKSLEQSREEYQRAIDYLKSKP
jgi:hypothetical protein